VVYGISTGKISAGKVYGISAGGISVDKGPKWLELSLAVLNKQQNQRSLCDKTWQAKGL
jgi:hypothetical protein